MIIVSSAYLAPIQYYAHLYSAGQAVEDREEYYVKQTYRNRAYIATPGGVQPLTIPVVRSGATHTPVRDIRISDHGNWRHLHWNALVSAYENSPFFEYYADDFRVLYEKPFDFLVDFNEALEHTVLDLLGIETHITLASSYVTELQNGTLDLRQVISPKVAVDADPMFVPKPYYQVFAGRTGFLPNLSIVDLLFNHGNESRIILRDCIVK